jgi:hypothetical protein
VNAIQRRVLAQTLAAAMYAAYPGVYDPMGRVLFAGVTFRL